MHAKLLQLCLTLDTLWTVACQAPLSMGFSRQEWILEWVAMPSSRGSSQPWDGTWVSCIAGRFFTTEPLGKPQSNYTAIHLKKIFFNVKRKGILTHALTWVNLEDMMSRGNKPVTKGPKLLVRRLKLQELIVPLRCPIHHLSPNAECSIWTTGDAQQWTKKCQRNGWVQIWSSGR